MGSAKVIERRQSCKIQAMKNLQDGRQAQLKVERPVGISDEERWMAHCLQDSHG
jgi:hypothetical protein